MTEEPGQYHSGWCFGSWIVRSNFQYASIGLDNGLVPKRPQRVKIAPVAVTKTGENGYN